MRSVAIGIILIAIIITGFALVPIDFVNAAENGLVPDCGAGLIDGKGSRACGFCDLISLADRVLAFIVELAVIASAVMFAIVGIVMMVNSGKPEVITKAKSIFGKVFIGLIVVLGAWLLVDTILKIVSQNTRDLGRPWETFTCSQSGGGSSLSDSKVDTSTSVGVQTSGVDKALPTLTVPKAELQEVPPFTPPTTITPLDIPDKSVPTPTSPIISPEVDRIETSFVCNNCNRSLDVKIKELNKIFSANVNRWTVSSELLSVGSDRRCVDSGSCEYVKFVSEPNAFQVITFIENASDSNLQTKYVVSSSTRFNELKGAGVAIERIELNTLITDEHFIIE